MRKILSGFFLLGIGLTGLIVIYLIVFGLPPDPVLGLPFRLKSIRKPCLWLLLLLGGYLLAGGRPRIQRAREQVESWCGKPFAIWALFTCYSALFVWQQITEYLALEINFFPFSFYDYMLYFLTQGKINYTGYLHGYYHLNNFMALLFPFWYLWKSSLFLVLLHGVVLAAGAVPLYYLAREKLGRTFGVCLAFVYLNYRYLLNLLTMNFSVESFYPLMAFLVILFLNRNVFLYYLFLILALMIKEDSFIYFGGWGLYLLAFTPNKREGLITVSVSVAYIAFLLKYFIPLTQGSDSILVGDLRNFSSMGGSVGEILNSLLKRPWLFLQGLFYPWEKVETLLKVFSRFLFVPCLTPACLLVFVTLSPLFLHGGENFIGLRFHYSAPMIAFVFFSVIEGWHFLMGKVKALRRKEPLLGFLAVLIFLNVGNYFTYRFSMNDLVTVRLLRQIPSEAVLLTHGHLLPHSGYRPKNFYLSWNMEKSGDPDYSNPEYCLLDRHVNPYPMSPDFVEDKIEIFRKRKEYKLTHDDGVRFLFEKTA